MAWDSEKGNSLPSRFAVLPRVRGLLYIHNTVHTTVFVTPTVINWLSMRN